MDDVASAIQRLVRIDGLQKLGDAARHKDVAIAQSDQRRVPAAVGHITALAPGVGRLIEYPRILDAFQLCNAEWQAVYAGLRVVVGATDSHHIAVCEANNIRAEQRTVVFTGVICSINQAVEFGAVEEGLAVIAVRIGTGIQWGRFEPGRVVAFIKRQYTGLIVDRDFAEFGDD